MLHVLGYLVPMSIVVVLVLLGHAILQAPHASSLMVTMQNLLTVPLAMTALYTLLLGGFLGRIAQPKSTLRTRVWRMTGISTLWVSTVLTLGLFVPDASWAMQNAGAPWLMGLGAAWLLSLTALVITMPSYWLALLTSFWPAEGYSPQDLLLAVNKYIREDAGLPSEQSRCGLQVRTARAGQTIAMDLDIAHAPGRLNITIDGHTLQQHHPGLSIRRRQPDSPAGASLGDPILQGILFIEADSPAPVVALVRQHHAVLMALFHAWPETVLHNGRLELSILDPPFQGASQPADIGRFVAQRLTDCMALVELFQGHAVPTAAMHKQRSPRGITEPQ